MVELPAKSGSTARPSNPRSQKLWTCVRKSTTVVGVGSRTLSNSLISPLFSATSTRPSGRKRSVVGWSSPPKTTASEKPGCLKLVAARAGKARSAVTRSNAVGAARRGRRYTRFSILFTFERLRGGEYLSRRAGKQDVRLASNETGGPLRGLWTAKAVPDAIARPVPVLSGVSVAVLILGLGAAGLWATHSR